ncbi:hydroxyisourate hydrolase [Streptomyces netropsis]
MSLSIEVRDNRTGLAATGLRLSLQRRQGDVWADVATGTVDSTGHANAWPVTAAGRNRLVVNAEEYFAETGTEGLYTEASFAFRIADPADELRILLLLTPASLSVYRT